MAILPLNHAVNATDDRQESMFAPEIAPELDASFAPETDFSQESHADFRTLIPYEAEELASTTPLNHGLTSFTASLTYNEAENEFTPEAIDEPETSELAEPSEPAESSSPFVSQADESGQSTAVESSTGKESLSTGAASEFASLEERVLRAVSLVRHEREARIAAEQRTALLESQLLALQAESAIADQLQLEVDSLRAEREQVRQRVDRLLSQLDALEL